MKRLLQGAGIGLILGSLFWLTQSAVSDPAQTAVSVTTVTPFQIYMNAAACVTSVCTINFPVIPAKSRLEIRNTSCYIKGLGTEGQPAQFKFKLMALQLLVRKASSVIATAVTLVPVETDTYGNTGRVLSSNDSVFVFGTAGQHFQAYALGTALLTHFEFFACSISGEMVTQA